MVHRDGLPRLLARSARRSDVVHRKPCATPSKSLGKPPVRSFMRPVGGRRKTLTMHRIVGGFPPTTGKPVHVFALNRVSAKLRAFHATLEARGAARRFEGRIETWDYPPLAEADRVAAEIDARLL